MKNPFLQALELLFSGDHELYGIVLTSLRISLTSVFFASLVGIPVGIMLKFKDFPGKKSVIAFLSSLMALPTVLIGLMFYNLLTRRGPLGHLNILFTPTAIIMGQIVLSLPLITTMIHSGLHKLDDRFHETLITLGAKSKHILSATIFEARFVILSAILAGFGRVIGEIGVSMMLGGNIRWFTRTITTTIALENSKGAFGLSIALGIILMLLAVSINFILHMTVKNEN